jgi:sugar lactone lactonase YvrE
LPLEIVFVLPSPSPRTLIALAMIAVTTGCAGLPGSPASRLKPTVSTAGKPAKALSATERRAAVQEKLLAVAKVTYTNAQVGIVSNNGGTANAFKTSGIIANNGGNVISNNGGNVISNNGGNVAGGGAVPYRAAARRVAAVPVTRTVNGQMAAGETLGRHVRWTNGVSFKAFLTGENVIREVEYDATGRAVREKLDTVLARGPRGLVKESTTRETLLNEQGAFSSFRAYRDVYAEGGELSRSEFERAVVEDPVLDLYMEANELVIDTEAGEGRFAFVYPKLKLRETGTLRDVQRDETNRIYIDLGDPLAHYGGVSRVETLEGVPVYTRTHTITYLPPTVQGTLPPRVETRYDLLNGLSLDMHENREAGQFEGSVLQGETAIGAVIMRQSPGGAVSFRVVLDGATAPLVIGYGDGPWPNETPFPPDPEPSPSGATPSPSPSGATPSPSPSGATPSPSPSGATPSPSPFGATPSPSGAATSSPRPSFVAEGKYWFVASVAGSGQAGWLDGIDIGAHKLNQPAGLVVRGASGRAGSMVAEVLIADSRNHRIRRCWQSPTDNRLESFAGDGEAGHRDGPAAQARFNGPEGLALGPDGTLYVAEREGHRIRKISPQGIVSTLAGDGTEGFADGPGARARFFRPTALAVDAAGTVYVADVGNCRIRKITAQGVVSTLAGDGTAGFADGPGAQARFTGVTGLVLMPDGSLLAADPLNRRIRRVTTAGVVSTYAGGGESATRDGRALEAAFVLPFGLTRDRAGNVYVTDTGAHRIRRVTPAGEVHTIAGGGIVGLAGGTDGLMHRAHFFEPSGIIADESGERLYVADRSNHRVRIVLNDKLW